NTQYRGQIFFNSGIANQSLQTLQYRVGNTAQGWTAVRTVWDDNNFNPAQYVMQSALNTQLANYGTLAGTQTWTGANTFTQAIYIPAGTLNGHAVNLGQMQSYVTGLGYTTLSAVQSWVNSQNFATQSQIITPNNG